VGTCQLTATYAAQGNYQASHATAILTVNPDGGGGPVATSITINVPSSIIQNDHNARAYIADKVDASNYQPPFSASVCCFRGRPRGRSVDCKPKRCTTSPFKVKVFSCFDAQSGGR